MLDYEKYKGLSISVVLFLLLNTSVLITNFYTSFQISKDTLAVNFAGRQQMLSQRAMKVLLEMQISQNDAAAIHRATEELSAVATLFDETLNAFDKGGEVEGGSAGVKLLTAVSTVEAKSSVDRAKQLWQPFHQKIDTVLTAKHSNLSYPALVRDVVVYGNANNIKLLNQMNKLTIELEAVVSSKANRLRTIQIVASVLVSINFLFIVMYFIRQRRELAEESEASKTHIKNISSTADQGLLTPKEFNNVEDYDVNMKQRLVGSLKHIETGVAGCENHHANKYLKVSFSHESDISGVKNIRTSVTDVSQQVKLANELAQLKKGNEQQIQMMSIFLKANPNLVQMFIQSSATAYSKINSLLERTSQTDKECRKKASDLFALINNVKSDSGILSFDVITKLCRDFEIEITSIEDNAHIQSNDFLSLTVILEELNLYGRLLNGMYSNVYAGNNVSPKVNSHMPYNWSHLKIIANIMAARQGKKVEVTTAGLNDNYLQPEFLNKLNSISVQLVRNAVTHGIEKIKQRATVGKVDSGSINISLVVRSSGEYRFTFSDDGQGVNKQKLLESAVTKKRISEVSAQTMSLKNVTRLMFESHVSQNDEVDIDSGRGIGLYSVKNMVKEMGGKISVNEVPGRGVSFVIRFPAESNLSE